MSAFERVLKLTHKWAPEPQSTELKYRNSLAAFLRANLKNAKIETEYRHKGTTIDIYVRRSGFLGSTEVFVELKRNLLQKAQLDRLVGQLASMQPCCVLIVLCGETSPALLKRLKETCHITDDLFLDLSFFGDKGIAVIVKDHAKAQKAAGSG